MTKFPKWAIGPWNDRIQSIFTDLDAGQLDALVRATIVSWNNARRGRRKTNDL